jgi:hypothetical protein
MRNSPFLNELSAYFARVSLKSKINLILCPIVAWITRFVAEVTQNVLQIAQEQRRFRLVHVTTSDANDKGQKPKTEKQRSTRSIIENPRERLYHSQ